jgi:hypothetical protein
MVVIQFTVHVAPVSQKSRADVPRQFPASENLGDRSGGLAAPDFKLKQARASHVIALRKEQIGFALGIDMSHAPRIQDDLHGCAQPGMFQQFRARSRFGQVKNQHDGYQPAQRAPHTPCENNSSRIHRSLPAFAATHLKKSVRPRYRYRPLHFLGLRHLFNSRPQTQLAGRFPRRPLAPAESRTLQSRRGPGRTD